MARPGTEVTLLDTPGAISVPTDTGTAFITGLTDRGPLVPTRIRSLSEFVEIFGNRVTYSVLYDWVDHFFREGGNAVYVSRVVGPNPTSGVHNLLDNAAATSLIVTADGPGAWSANYKVAVVAGGVGGTYVIQVTDANNVVLEDSGNLADQQSAVNWSKNSKYVRVSLGVSALNPAVAAPAALSAGTDDRANVTDTQWLNAQNLFSDDLGPGQVVQPGRTSSTAHSQLTDHAETHNRVAILDLPDSATLATLEASLPTTYHRFAAGFAPWLQIPWTMTGVYRTVPPSALVCGLIAKNDPAFGTNAPSAGRNGISSYASGLTQAAWSDTDRETLNNQGINVIRPMGNTIRVYGWRSLADPINDLSWLDFGNARLYMRISAELQQTAENYVFTDITPSDISGYHDALAGVLMRHYNDGELYGDTPDQAFAVDTGDAVNTPTTIANLELHGVCYVRMTNFAEWVPIEVVKRQITEAVV